MYATHIVDFREQRALTLQSPNRRKMDQTEFSIFAQEYIDVWRRNRKDYAAYKNALKHFHTFETSRGITFLTNQIGCDLLIQFHSFMQLQKGLKMSTASGIIVKIKYLLNRAYDEGWDVCNSFRETRVSPGETFAIALTTLQIDQLLFYDNLSERDKEIRDMFIFMCLSGLRYSDARMIGPEHIHGDIITKKMQKTKKTVHVPIDSGIKKILERNDGRPPHARSAQHFNSRIKKICEWAKLTDLIHYEIEIAGDVKMVSARLCDMISSHTGRRSFVTNNFEKGNGVDVIKPMTGHASADCLLRYYKQSGEKNARILAAKAS